jgi:putative nucleotidyltransferase with HDIG domain
MSDLISSQTPSWFTRQRIFLGLLFVLTALLSALALFMPSRSDESRLPIAVGDVANVDILAPKTLSFESHILTEAIREESAAAVASIYGPPDANVARDQVEKLGNAVAFIESVRNDEFASIEQKLSDIAALQNINLGQERAIEILELDDDAWQKVSVESTNVLEQIMRSTIRQDRVENARISSPALVSLSLTENQAEIAAELASAFVTANSFYSESLTYVAREEARSGIAPIVVTFLNDEIILERGQVVSEADLEVLEEFGLVQNETRWQEYVGIAAIVIASSAVIFLFLRNQEKFKVDSRPIIFVAITFLVFLFSSRFLILDRTVIPYIFPIAGFGLLVSTILGTQAALVFSFILGLLAAYNLPSAVEISMYYILGSWIGILIIRKAQRLMAYFWAGAAISGAGMHVLFAYQLPQASTDLIGMATLIGAALVNGFASATLTIVMQLGSANLLGLTTTVQLQELSRPDHPLLQFILRNAPGTYQHSLQISNLAEQAADRIGANALLTRVGSLYHDAGKARQPIYFIENQVPGTVNPHNELSPLESSRIIIRHVSDGLKLAEKHRLPQRIRDFIAEHHGDLITQYQYGRAIKAAHGDDSKVKSEDFQYPGPKPQSAETALVMLADGCEARTRAERPATREELQALVRDVIEQRLASGQLSHTALTMNDLLIIQDSFVSTLRGIYHPRIKYPKIEKVKAPEIEAKNSGS